MGKKANSNRKIKKKRERRRWALCVTIGTFFSTILFTYISDLLLNNTALVISVIILLSIILIGILSDILGIAVASASLGHFNAMAAQKVKGAKTCVKLVKNAARVSSICNDVVGDICGIISGATSVAIVAQILAYRPLWDSILVGLLVSGVVASLTVGGKAFCKDFGLDNSTAIIHAIAKPIAAVRIFFTGHE